VGFELSKNYFYISALQHANFSLPENLPDFSTRLVASPVMFIMASKCGFVFPGILHTFVFRFRPFASDKLCSRPRGKFAGIGGSLDKRRFHQFLEMLKFRAI
jgi:hypothetical protein